MDISKRIHDAADYIRRSLTFTPTIGLILGSGLGDFADSLQDRIVIPFSEVPDISMEMRLRILVSRFAGYLSSSI